MANGSLPLERESQLTTHCRDCPLCEAHCGTLVTIDKARREIVAIRGDPDDPFSRGYICPKAYSMKELHRDPNVIRTPLIKRNGVFVETSWSEALDYTAQRLQEIRSARGLDSIGLYIGNPTAHHPGLLLYSPLLLAELATKQIYCAGSVDIVSRILTSVFMYGDCSLHPVPDIDRTDLFIVHGANPVVSNGSMVTAPGMPNRIKALRARGGRMLVIDPRRTETAELADLHVPIRPGTDAWFLLSVVHHLFASGRVDLGRLAGFSDRLEVVQLLVQAFPPKSVADICGVPADMIRRVAEEFSASGAAVWYGRTGTCTQSYGTLCCWLQELLNILTGNLDRAGGSMFPAGIVPSILYAEKYTGDVPPFDRWRSRVSQLPELAGVLPTAALAEEILTPGDGQIRAFITMAGNPVLSLPNGNRLAEAFDSLEFMLSLDIYLNETTRHADVILPSPFEMTHSNFDLYFIPYAVRKVAKWNPALFALDAGEMNDWDVFLGLVSRLTGKTEEELEEANLTDWLQRFHIPTEDGASLDRARAALGNERGPDRLLDILVRTGPNGDNFSTNASGLSLERIAQSPHGLDLGPMEPQLPGLLATPNGRIDLAPELIVKDIDRLLAERDRMRDPETLLLIGRRHIRSNNSWMHNLNVLIKGKDRCTLMIHPDDASPRGLANGDVAAVWTDIATLEIVTEVTDSIMRGVVSIPHGWGHNKAATRLDIANGHAGANVNVLIDDVLFDKPSINAALNGIPVRVAAVLSG